MGATDNADAYLLPIELTGVILTFNTEPSFKSLYPFFVNERIPARVEIVAGSFENVLSILKGPSSGPSSTGT